MKIFIIALTAFTLLFVSACQPQPDSTGPEPESDTSHAIEPVTDPTKQNLKEQPVSFLKSELPREIDLNIDEDQIKILTENNAAFALAFYNQIPDKDDNLVFSPFSISLALSMTLAGAESDTEQAMLKALQFGLPEKTIHTAFNALLQSIEQSQEPLNNDMENGYFQLNISNSIWGQEDFNFKTAFLDVLAQHYGAGLFAVDFKQNPEGSRLAINDWVSEETEEKIKDLIPENAINSLTRLVLTNAIYFNGSWLHPFNKNQTAESPFYTLDGSEILVESMKLFGENLAYGQGENYQAIDLPYLSSDFVMTLLVPDTGTFNEFEAQLSQEELVNIFENMDFTQVDLEMPKFDFESDINANDPLIALGMGNAFDPELADFSGIADDEALMISDVLHKATITVDESGAEAAAATAVIVGIKSVMPVESISLIIDRPFLFMIRHQPTNTILFMGRVIQP